MERGVGQLPSRDLVFKRQGKVDEASTGIEHCSLIRCFRMVLSHDNSDEDTAPAVVGAQFDVG